MPPEQRRICSHQSAEVTVLPTGILGTAGSLTKKETLQFDDNRV